MSIEKIHNAQTHIEEVANFAGGLPILGIIVGSARCVAGSVQSLVGIIFASIGVAGQICAKVFNCSENAVHTWKVIKWEGLEQSVHGLGNNLQGLFEIFEHTFCALGLYGLSFPMTLEVGFARDFQPYFEYGSFEEFYK